MQLTRAADYAVRVMIHLAGLPAGTRVSRTDLSKAVSGPEQFLCKVLQNLTRAGLMNSHRGNTGGFELSSRQRQTTLLEVVEAIEGPVRLNLCLDTAHHCVRQSWCPARGVWSEAQQALTGVLAGVTVTDLAERVKDPSTPELIEALV